MLYYEREYSRPLKILKNKKKRMGFIMAFVKNLVVENARVVFRNFEGKETKFNRKGDRNFCVLFDKEQGEELIAQGWNLKILQPRDEEDEPAYCLSVKVMFGKIPPKVYMIANRKKTLLDEETIGLLDHAEIENADLIIRPYNWNVNGKSGIKAYVQTMYVELRVDKFASKYDFDDCEPAYEDELPF